MAIFFDCNVNVFLLQMENATLPFFLKRCPCVILQLLELLIVCLIICVRI